MRRNTLAAIFSFLFVCLTWAELAPLINNYTDIVDNGVYRLLTFGSILVPGVSMLALQLYSGKKDTEASSLVWGAAFAGFLVGAVLSIGTYSGTSYRAPVVRAAVDTCKSIHAGMTFEELKRTYGHLFWAEKGDIVLNALGNADIALKNDIWQINANCEIRIKNHTVESAYFVNRSLI